MIDIDTHTCKTCSKLIPINRDWCYVCDLVVNGNRVKTPQTVHELVDEFLHNADLKDYEPEDVIAIFDRFEEHIASKKYRITIQ